MARKPEIPKPIVKSKEFMRGVLNKVSILRQRDCFDYDFTLMDFVNVTGIRLQSLPNIVNTGELFLAGKGDEEFILELSTIVLLESGVLGLALYGRMKFGKNEEVIKLIGYLKEGGRLLFSPSFIYERLSNM